MSWGKQYDKIDNSMMIGRAEQRLIYGMAHNAGISVNAVLSSIIHYGLHKADHEPEGYPHIVADAKALETWFQKEDKK